MKKFLNKNVCFLVIIAQLLSSCLATRALWNGGSPSSKYDGIKSFFIDKSGKRVVLIGVGNFKHMNDHYHYSLEDPEGKLLRVFELAQKSGDANFAAYQPIAKGSDFMGGFWIGFRNKNLSADDLKFVEENELNKGANKDYLGMPCRFDNDEKNKKESYRWPLVKTIRHPSTLETLTNLCSYEEPKYKEVPNKIFDKDGKYLKTLNEPKLQLISQPKPKSSNSPDCIPITTFNQPWQGVIWEEYTTSQKATRAVVTPFTVALDTLLLPIIVPLFVYSLYQQSTTNYWCQGEFCGYDNKQGNQTSATNTKPTTTSKPTSKTKPDSNQNLNQNLNQKQN